MTTGRPEQPTDGQGLSLCVFAIATDPFRFGTIRWSHALGRDAPEPGRRCYDVFRNEHNCGDCPARSDKPKPAPRMRKVDSGYELVSAEQLEPGTAQIWRLELDEQTLDHLIQMRLVKLTTGAGLTQREEQVLQLLMFGRSRREIGVVLGISPRTVKFHEANLLKKLGADSVQDLLRLLL